MSNPDSGILPIRSAPENNRRSSKTSPAPNVPGILRSVASDGALVQLQNLPRGTTPSSSYRMTTTAPLILGNDGSTPELGDAPLLAQCGGSDAAINTSHTGHMPRDSCVSGLTGAESGALSAGQSGRRRVAFRNASEISRSECESPPAVAAGVVVMSGSDVNSEVSTDYGDDGPPTKVQSTRNSRASSDNQSVGSRSADLESKLMRIDDTRLGRFMAGFDRRVPFAVQVFGFMILPIAFLVVVLLIAFIDKSSDAAFASKYGPFLAHAGECQSALMVERGVSSQALAVAEAAALATILAAAPAPETYMREEQGKLQFPPRAGFNVGNASAELATWQEKLPGARAAASSACELAVRFALRGDPAAGGLQKALHDDWAPAMRRNMNGLVLLRAEVDALRVDGRGARLVLTPIIAHVLDARVSIQREAGTLGSGSALMAESNELWFSFNELGACRALGSHVLTMQPLIRTVPTGSFGLASSVIGASDGKNAAVSLLLRDRWVAGVSELTGASETYHRLRSKAAFLGQESLRVPVPSLAGRRALELLTALVADPLGFTGVTVPQWFAAFTAAVDEIPNAADTLRADALAAMLLTMVELAVALIISVLCGAGIIWAQMRAQRRTEAALAITRRTQQAVLAFVPKPFLRMAGYTSILQVSAGDQTEVAAAMLFSDIRGFTTLAEGMTNMELFDWLQEYFGRVTTVTQTHHGFIDKFIGDAIFAVFNTAHDSVRCSASLQESAQQLNVQITSRGGECLVEVGVGIHYAVVAVGFLGDAQRLTCTMISSEVNLASRLEGLTRHYGCGILVSAQAFDQLDSIARGSTPHRRLGMVQPKGASSALEVYEVFQVDPIALKRHKAATVSQFELAVAARSAGRTAESREAFEAVAAAARTQMLVDGAAEFKARANDAVDVFDEK